MKITYFDNYLEMSQRAAQLFLNELSEKQDLLLCAAAGNSPRNFYELLAEKYTTNPGLFNQLRILKLDEWGGVPMQDPNSCHSYLQTNVLTPLHITGERYIGFDTTAKDSVAECDRVQKKIDQTSPIDCCILGLGKNGHIGFNEPSSYLQSECHIAKLSAETVRHAMVQSISQSPTFGMTVGMKDILQSRKIYLLITGKEKQDVINRLLKQKITTQLPASFLWLHPNVEFLIDKTSC